MICENKNKWGNKNSSDILGVEETMSSWGQERWKGEAWPGLRRRRLMAVEWVLVQRQSGGRGCQIHVSAGGFQVKEEAGGEGEAHWFGHIHQFISRGRLDCEANKNQASVPLTWKNLSQIDPVEKEARESSKKAESGDKEKDTLKKGPSSTGASGQAKRFVFLCQFFTILNSSIQ